MGFQIVKLTEELAALGPTLDGGPAWHRDAERWQQVWRENVSGERVTLVALHNKQMAGYASLLWKSLYLPFRQDDTPQITAMVVAATRRQNGMGEALVKELEALADKAGCLRVGAGIPLTAEFGGAQRLYLRMGYLPDGRGVTSGNDPLKAGDTVTVDRRLMMWFTKVIV